MRMLRFTLLLALLATSACGTEIDADRGAAEMAAALSLDPVHAADADDQGSLETVTAVTRIDPPAGFTAALYSEHDVEVGARTAGAVRALHAELGDAVEAGAVLAVLEDGVELASLATAEAQLEMVRAEHARVVALAAREIMTPAELERSVFRLRAAEAAHDDARARLEHTRMRAPFAGLVARRFVRLGESVDEGEPLFRVTAMRPLRAQIRVPELAARHVARGDRVTLRSLDGREVAGRVGRVAPTIDAASGTVEVLIDVADPRGLQPGATVSARFTGD